MAKVVMVYHGRVKGGVIELEEGIVLPEGTNVRVEADDVSVSDDASSEPVRQERPSIFDLGRNPISLGITDASVNHDQYIYEPDA